jgi:sigma-B regulation protein RsbU (phosphoserine phosphatase)
VRADGARAAPSEILAHVNEDLCRDNPELMFVTVFMAVLDLDKRTLAYCNAGHVAPCVIRDNSDVVELTDAHGRALGIRPQAPYETGMRMLSRDETLFVYTDGITEAESAAGEFFGDSRLASSLRAAAGKNARGMVDAVVNAVREFAAGIRQSDDIAAIAVRLAY